MARIDRPEDVTDAGAKQTDGPVGPRRDQGSDEDDDAVLETMPQRGRAHAGTAGGLSRVRAEWRRAASHAVKTPAGSMATCMGHS